MRRLSRSIADLKIRYDVVVVGSGYGGGVAASRLARCGRSVCVLERGREFQIGEFPDQMIEAAEEFQVSGAIVRHGSPLGLYDLRLGRDMHVLVGCGLGGTSLINANVALQPDRRLWEDPCWPDELPADPALEEGYARAQRMLRPSPCPADVKLAKLDALATSAKALGASFSRPPINVTFREEVNHAGVRQPACTMCGDCCAGCNVGAKNTVQMTYLPDAAGHGAEIFTETRVTHVRKEGLTWRVFFEMIGTEREKFGVGVQSVVADVVILAAGTLGSTEILHRSQSNGLQVSTQIGKRFTGNGDVLAFGYNNETRINGIGFGHPPPKGRDPVGPCIAGLIDMRNSARVDDGLVIEEGTIPSGLAPLLPTIFASGSAAFGSDTDFSLGDEIGEAGRSLSSLLRGAYHGALNHTHTYLVMAHDGSAGIMKLEDDKLAVSWPEVASKPIFERVDQVLREATAAHGGTYVKNPMSSTLLGKNLITVHPLGGCVIGRTRASGVVNHKCQVFDGDPSAGDRAVHEGLYVCDGAVVPRSLGVNPLLTITALAERAMIHLARDRGWRFDDAINPRLPELAATAESERVVRPAGVMFTERMTGFVSSSSVEDYNAAAAAGEGAADTLAMTGTIIIDNIDRFEADPRHTGRIVGTVLCPTLAAEPMMISSGVFNLMRVDEDAVETRRFDYGMVLTDREGRSYRLDGHKVVRADGAVDVVDDTTRLYVTVRDGTTASGRIVRRGVLTIAFADFIRQLRTMKGIDGANAADRLAAVSRFGKLFARNLFEIYGGVFTPLDRFDKFRQRKKRALRTSAPTIHAFTTEDGKTLRLTRYRGGGKGPVMLSHGLGVSTKIFSIDTIDTNLVEFLYAAGYDCWLLDYRASTDLAYCREQWTADDVARFDYPAAIQRVRKLTGRQDVQMVVHCFGATTFFMAMLTGLQGVRSAVVSQIATDVIVPWWPQRLLAHLRTPSLLSALGVEVVNARAQRHDNILLKLVDSFIRLVIPFQREERSHNATSNRITALYGPLYELDQLNNATASSGLPEMFGEANISAFKQLAAIARREIIVDASGADVYLAGLELLKLPIRFIHGAENACFRPESTERTLKRLEAVNGVGLYDRKLIPGYGHIDCIFGKNAARDVFPFILEHLERTQGAVRSVATS